jgi:hypothetical protein
MKKEDAELSLGGRLLGNAACDSAAEVAFAEEPSSQLKGAVEIRPQIPSDR